MYIYIFSLCIKYIHTYKSICISIYFISSEIMSVMSNSLQLFATVQSMEFSRPVYWIGQLFPSPEALPNPGIEPRSPHYRQILYQLATRDACICKIYIYICAVCSNRLLLSCLTLCDPMDYSPPGSLIHGILQSRILEWVTTPPPGDLPDRDQTCVS